MKDGEVQISDAAPFCRAVVAKRMTAERMRRAEVTFDVSFDDAGRWRYASTLPESAERRDVVIYRSSGEWLVRVNAYRGEGGQLLCDDADWTGGMVLGEGRGLSYEDAVRHAIRWLSDGRWNEEIG